MGKEDFKQCDADDSAFIGIPVGDANLLIEQGVIPHNLMKIDISISVDSISTITYTCSATKNQIKKILMMKIDSEDGIDKEADDGS